MTCRRTCLIAVLALLWPSVAGAQAIKNANFSNGLQGWEADKQSAAVERTEGQAGFHLRIFSDKSGHDPAVVQKGIRIQPGAKYRLSYSVRAGGGSSEVTGYQFFRVYATYMPQVVDGKQYGGMQQEDGAEWQDVLDQWQVKTLEFRAPQKAVPGMNINCQVRGPGSIQLANFKLELIPEDENASGVSIDIRSPWYRDCIFASVPVEKIEGSAAVSTKGYAQCVVQLKRGDDVLAERKFSKDQQVEFAFPAAQLAHGAHQVRVTVLDDSGKLLEESSRQIRKLEPRENEVAFGRDHVTLVDGKPWFPIGVFRFVPEDAYVYEMARAGINAFIGPLEPKYLDQVDKYNVKLMAHINPKLPHLHNAEGRRRWTGIFLDRYNPLFNHKGLLGFFLSDEPLWRGIPLDELLDSYEFHRRLNPYRPVWINEAPRNTIAELAEYARACDVVGVDIYPVPLNSHSGLSDKKLTCVGGHTRKSRQVVQDRKPVWMTLQAFAWIHLSKPDHPAAVYPTYEELRFMAYDAVMNGATGVWFWGTDHIVKDEFWDVLLKTTAELRDISAVLVCPTVADSPASSPNPAVRIMHKKCGGYDYFFAANVTDAPTNAKISTALGVDSLDVAFEGRRAELKNGALTDRFEPFGVHIYTNAPSLPKPLVEPPPKDERLEGGSFLKRMRSRSANLPPYKGNAKWIWAKSPANDQVREVSLARKVNLPDQIKSATLLVTADDACRVFVNGKPIGDAEYKPGWTQMKKYDIAARLGPGDNVITVEAKDMGNEFCAGVLCDVVIQTAEGGQIQIVSDEEWTAADDKANDGMQVYVVGPYGAAPWLERVRILQ